MDEEDLQNEDDSDRGWSRRRRPTKGRDFDYQKDSQNEDSDIFDSGEIVDRLPES